MKHIPVFVASLFVMFLAISSVRADDPTTKPIKYHPSQIEVIVYADFPKDPKHWDTLAQFVADKGFTAVEERMDKLDVCRKHGLKMRLGSEPGLMEALPTLKDDPAVLGYFISDHREKKTYPGFAAMARKFEESDPNHPTLFIYKAEYNQLPYFLDTVRPMMVDYYHYHWFHHGDQYFSHLKALRDQAVKRDIAQMRCLSSGVSAVQIRQSMYCSLAYGVTAFHFWTPWLVGFKNTEKDKVKEPILEDGKIIPTITKEGEAISAVALELKTIGPVLVKLRHEVVYHTEPQLPGTNKAPADFWVQPQGELCLVSVFRDEKENRYLLAVNHAIDKPRELTLALADEVHGLEIMDRKSGKWIELKVEKVEKSKSIHLTLEAGDGELIRVLLTK